MFRALVKMVEDMGWGRMLGGLLVFVLCTGVLIGMNALTSRWIQRRVSSRGLGLTLRGAIGVVLGAVAGALCGFLVQYVWKPEESVYLEVAFAIGVLGAVFGLLLGVGWTGKGAKLGVPAGCFMLLGVFLLTEPSFRARRDTLSLADALPGLGAILAGVVLVGLMVWSAVRQAPVQKPEKKEPVA
jgi:hypothetical protein